LSLGSLTSGIPVTGYVTDDILFLLQEDSLSTWNFFSETHLENDFNDYTGLHFRFLKEIFFVLYFWILQTLLYLFLDF